MALGWQTLHKTDTVVNGKCWLYRVILNASVDGGYVDLYDGQDALSGKLVCRVVGQANATRDISFGGIPLTRGLHVVFGTNAARVLAIYSTTPPPL